MISSLELSLVALAIFTIYRLVRSRRSRKLPLPPGPPADPIIGHMRVIPTKNSEDVFYQWGKIYGDVLYLYALGKSIVVLNSEEAATDLLDKRSANYSSRPEFSMPRAIGWTDILSFLPYGDAFIEQRKVIQQPFLRKTVEQYRPIQEDEVTVLLHNFLQDPIGFDSHLHRLATGVIFNIIYGYRVVSADDESLRIAERFVALLVAKVPSWFPGAWHVKYIPEATNLLQTMIDYPMKLVREQMRSGSGQQSVVRTHLEALDRDGPEAAIDYKTLRIAAHQVFAGGAETTWHTLTTFMACMMLNPEAQKRGQQEIDTVVGNGRLPEFSDRDSLPFVECIMKETMRWHPVVPAVPHASLADDEYRGMLIPGGSMVIANTRAMTLDERRFSDPHSFIPERFLPKPEGRGEVISDSIIFGWGRRVCPGRWLANDTVWLAIARILATFDVLQALDSNGQACAPEIKYVTAITSHPEPFNCVIRPRSERAAALAEEAYSHTPHAAS